MAKKSSASGPSAEEICAAVQGLISDTAQPMTAAQLAKLLTALPKVSEKKLTPILEELVLAGTLRAVPASTARGKPRYWDRDVTLLARTAAMTAMQQATEPLTAKDVSTKISGPVKFTEAELTPVLNELVGARELHPIPSKTATGKPRYWTGDLGDFVRITLVRLLSVKGPLPLPALKKEVKGLSAAQFDEILERQIAGRQLFHHPPAGKKGKALIGSQPPRPEPYLAEMAASLQKTVELLRSADVSIESLRRALIQMIESAGVPFGSTSDTSSRRARIESVDLESLMRRVEPAADRGALVAPRQLRPLTNMTKGDFDRAVLELAAAGRISLHRHDYVASLTDDERNDLVTDGLGTYYVGLALRPNSDSQTDRTVA
jgi:hypothetical protein